ncbi:MAG: hypothetical protein JWQ84_1732 [Mucilaginibacter sp.]|nr:hypothetical protein [Mucilaginibacter sp.]MDB5016900.1 hypothetical protein [Mucilaginibacter sp.]
MEVNLKVIGVILIMLALVHSIFPKYFDWVNELSNISLINKQIMYVHTFFIALILIFMGLLCLTSANEIIYTKLGSRISLGLGIFWGARLYVQFFGYSTKLWRGKRLESMVHIMLSILWIYLSISFFLVAFKSY